MSLAGWEPALELVRVLLGARTARRVQRRRRRRGVPDVPPPGSARPQPATFALMSALLAGDWDVADASEPVPRREASGLIAAHLQWHLERGLRSLPLVDRTSG